MNEERQKKLEYITKCFNDHGIPIKCLEGTNIFETLYPIGIECGQYNERTVILELSKEIPKDRDYRLEIIFKELKKEGIELKIPHYNDNPDAGPIAFDRYLELTQHH